MLIQKSKTMGSSGGIENKVGSGSTQLQTNSYLKGGDKTRGSSSLEGSQVGGVEEIKNDQKMIVLQPIREVVSDTEEESHGRLSLSRKIDLLNVRDLNEEFEMKSKCLRRKSVDFEKDRARQKAKNSSN